MTDCIKKEMLVLFLDQELPTDQVQPIKHHLDHCPDCRKRLEDLEAIDVAIRSMPDIDVPTDFDADFWDALKTVQDTHPKKTKRQLYWKAYTAAGLAAMLIVLGGVSFFSRMDAHDKAITLIEDMDMFQNYELAANIELLENWEILTQMDDNS